jgi:hypothetical protein
MSKVSRSVALVAVALVFMAGVPAAEGAEPFGTTGCTGVRPGAWIEAPRGTVYTMGFVLKGTGSKAMTGTYVATVGHFVYPVFGTKTWKPTSGPSAYDARGKSIGRFVYAYHADTPAYASFGLVKLAGNVKASPQVCHFGGPTGIFDTIDRTPRTVGYYGNGFPLDEVSPARTAVVTGTSSEDNAIAVGLISPVDTGDSGAPFVTDGKALGYWDGGIGGGGSGAGFVVQRIGPWIEKVQEALKIKLKLLTAKPL